MPVYINMDNRGHRFRLHGFEDRGQTGDNWTVTHTAIPDITNDDLKSFKLTGDRGIHVEFFNSSEFKKTNSWSEARLTATGQEISIDDMNHSAGGYKVHNKTGDDRVSGKVSSIRISYSAVSRSKGASARKSGVGLKIG
jgi:hypothetical protein